MKKEMNPSPNNTFGEKLDRLFEENRKPDGRQYSQKELVESAPGVLSRVYLWRLRTGRATRPSYLAVSAITNFFGVDAGYFFGSDNAEPKSVERNTTVDQKNLSRKIALRSAELDLEDQKTILFMIEAIKKSRGKK